MRNGSDQRRAILDAYFAATLVARSSSATVEERLDAIVELAGVALDTLADAHRRQMDERG